MRGSVKTMRRICPACGNAFFFDEKLSPNRKFCCITCMRRFQSSESQCGAKVLSKESRQLAGKSKATIKITKAIDIFPELRPKVGSKWKAEKYLYSDGRTGYVIQTKKRINIRSNECEEVAM